MKISGQGDAMELGRDIKGELITGLREMPQFLQIVIGPRQVGKNTAIGQAADRLNWPRVVASPDVAPPPGTEWVVSQWRLARVKEASCLGPVLLVLDEIQKVPGWSEVVKRLWSEEQAIKAAARLLTNTGRSGEMLTHVKIWPNGRADR